MADSVDDLEGRLRAAFDADEAPLHERLDLTRRLATALVQDDPERARSLLDEARANALGADDAREAALCLLAQANLGFELYDLEGTHRLSTHAIAELVPLDLPRALAEALMIAGGINYRLGETTEAIAQLEHAHESMQRVEEPDLVLRARILNLNGQCWRAIDDHERALECFFRALEVIQAGEAVDELDIQAVVLNSIAMVHHLRKDTAEAIAYMTRALDIVEHLDGKDLGRIMLNLNMGRIQLDHDVERAIAHFERCHELAGEREDNAIRHTAAHALASARLRQGHLDEALALARPTVDHWRNVDDHIRLHTALLLLSDVLSERGEHDEAERSLLESHEVVARHDAKILMIPNSVEAGQFTGFDRMQMAAASAQAMHMHRRAQMTPPSAPVEPREWFDSA